jgi:quinol monooxygenase YgiN
MLVEMYLDNTALDIHIASPRLQKTRAAYGDMIESRNIAKTRIDGS